MKKNKSYLSFRLGKESYAVSVKKVLEVLQKQLITEVPNTPDYVKGVINFRGEIIPIIEMRRKLNISERLAEQKYVTIILELNIGDIETKIGAVVDGVKDVIIVPQKKIQKIPKPAHNLKTQFLTGRFKINDNYTMLMDFDKVLTDEEAQVISKI